MAERAGERLPDCEVIFVDESQGRLEERLRAEFSGDGECPGVVEDRVAFARREVARHRLRDCPSGRTNPEESRRVGVGGHDVPCGVTGEGCRWPVEEESLLDAVFVTAAVSADAQRHRPALVIGFTLVECEVTL